MSHPAGTGPKAQPLLRTMLGDVLRRARVEQHRTLSDVSRSARISMAYLSELERGRKEASSEVLAAICEALRIDLADVLTEVGRDLVEDRARRASVIRLESIRGRQPRGRQARSPVRRSGDTQCQLAA